MLATILNYERKPEGIFIRAIANFEPLINMPIAFGEEGRIIGNVVAQENDEITMLIYGNWESLSNRQMLGSVLEALASRRCIIDVEGNHIMLILDEIDGMFNIQHNKGVAGDNLDALFGVTPIEKHPEYAAIAESNLLKGLEKEMQRFFDKQ